VINVLRIKNHKQGHLFDPWEHLGPKRRERINSSWAGIFREHILPALPVDSFARCFKADTGRPTKELFMALGALILQQMNDVTDEETVDQLAFNIKWHYALDITGESDEIAYMCLKTLRNIRRLVIKSGLDEELFQRTTEVLAKAFSVDAGKQRLDSVHIRSNMRHLGRIGIFSKSIHRFLVNLKRQQETFYSQLENEQKELIERYFTEQALSCFSLVKPSESEKTLAVVSRDLFGLVRRFHEDAHVNSLHSYKLLCRVLEEQCSIVEKREEEGQRELAVAVKPAKEIRSSSLQNPSDPDAAYDAHKGQGYKAQIMETYNELPQDDEKKGQTLNLITHVAVERACEHDVHALIPALESTGERELAPREVLADSHYGSDDNVQQASGMGVEVISPVMANGKGKNSDEEKAAGRLNLLDFQLSEKKMVIACPGGHVPMKVKHTGKHCTAAFDSQRCNACPQRHACPVTEGKKHHYLRYRDKEARLALRKKKEATPEFGDKYRWRAGIEATNSELDRKTGIKQLRVRGMAAVRFCVLLKVIGVNLLRAARVSMAINAHLNPAGAADMVDLHVRNLILVFKERFYHSVSTIRQHLTEMIRLQPQNYPHAYKLTA